MAVNLNEGSVGVKQHNDQSVRRRRWTKTRRIGGQCGGRGMGRGGERVKE